MTADTHWNMGNSNQILEGKKSPYRWSNIRTYCPERLWDLHIQRCSKLKESEQSDLIRHAVSREPD